MKKFYEEPVVEITVFDAENIMTASTVVTGQSADLDAGYVAQIKATNEGVTTSYVDAQTYSNSYNW